MKTFQTRTYEMIAKTQKEYKRQVGFGNHFMQTFPWNAHKWMRILQRAQVILMLELSLSPKDRLNYLLKYSRPIGTNKKTRSLIVNRKVQVGCFVSRNSEMISAHGNHRRRSGSQSGES